MSTRASSALCRTGRIDLRGIHGDAVDEFGGTLCVGCRGKHCSIVSLQHFQPACDIGCMILARFKSQLQIGAQERGPEFCYQFFDYVTFASEPMTADVSIKPTLVARPVSKFMSQRRVVAIGVLEALERRHLDRIGSDTVKRAVATVPDGCTQCREEIIRMRDAGDRVERRRGLRGT